MPAESNTANLGLCPGALGGTADGPHTCRSDLVLLLSCPPGALAMLGVVGEEDIAKQRERQRDDAVDNEKPAPTSATANIVQIGVSGRLQETTEKSTDRASKPEDHGTLANFSRRVPAAEHVVNTRVETRFEEANEEAESVESLDVFDGGRAERGDAPSELERRDDPARRHDSQQQVARNLANDIADGPDGRASHQLVAVHVHVLLHATEEGIVDVGLVNILQKVTNRCKGENAGIHLKEQPALILRQIPGVPDVAFPCPGRLLVGSFGAGRVADRTGVDGGDGLLGLEISRHIADLT